MPIRGDGGSIILSCSNCTLLVELFASLRIVRGHNSAVLHHYKLPAVNDRRCDVWQSFRLGPENMRRHHVAGSTRLQRESGVLSLSHELKNHVPLVARYLSVLVHVLVIEESLKVLLGLLPRQRAIPVLVQFLEHRIERR